jgi:hypothetical protein
MAAGWLGAMTGNRLDALPAGASTVVDSATGDGTGSRAGGAIGTVAGTVVAAAGNDRDGVGGLVLGAVPAGTTVTVAAAVAGTVIGGAVDAASAAVRVTCATPADGVRICASRVYEAGVVAVPSGPSWQEAAPSPLGHSPVIKA